MSREMQPVVTGENLMQFIAGDLKPEPQKTEAAPEAPAEVNADAAADEKAKEPSQKQDKPKKLVPLDELIETRAQRNEARRAQERLQAELAAARAEMDRLREGAVAPAQVPEGKPQRSTFATDDDYAEALADYMAEQKLAKLQMEHIQREAQAREAEIEAGWQRNLETYKAQQEDFDEVVNACTVQFPRPLVAELRDLDHGPAVAYWLTHPDNEDEARRVIGLFERDLRLQRYPSAGVKALAKLDTKLSAKVQKAAKPAPVTAPEVSRAPAPVEPLKGGHSADVDPSRMTYAEHVAWRRKQGR